MDNKSTVEDRINAMKNIYLAVDGFFDKYSDNIPESAKRMIKEAILGDQQLKELMNSIDNYRPPKLLLVGRTGVGKSSLINALCGSYTAPVNDVKSCTANTSFYQCKDGDRVLMEIMDSRGIAESEQIDDSISAEEQLLQDVKKFIPDIVLLLLPANARDNVDKDVEFLKLLRKDYYAETLTEIPIITVINKVDDVAPARYKSPKEYTENKIENIENIVKKYRTFLKSKNLRVDSIIEVSSLIDWMDSDGSEVAASDIDLLTNDEIATLRICFDGRYKIDELRDSIEKSIKDTSAAMGFRMALKLDELIFKLSKKICVIFSGIAGTVALTPIPISDIFILISLQSAMVALIAMLSGRKLDMEAAKEFIFSLGGVGVAGFVFRTAAQQLSKLVNLLFAGAGSAISTGIASAGTLAVGNAAIAYYVEGEDLKKAKKELSKLKKEIKNNKTSKQNN